MYTEKIGINNKKNMFIALGTDIISVDRFKTWHSFSRKKLLRIFSEEEIDYCLQHPEKAAEKFAARFAAREALYKALSSASAKTSSFAKAPADETADEQISFLTLCSSIIISKKSSGIPFIKIKQDSNMFPYFENIKIALSLSHEKEYALATVILYSCSQD